jgi:hypothetical protein
MQYQYDFYLYICIIIIILILFITLFLVNNNQNKTNFYYYNIKYNNELEKHLKMLRKQKIIIFKKQIKLLFYQMLNKLKINGAKK